MNALDIARHLSAEGFCVIPLCPDGKKPARKWKPYQYCHPTDEAIEHWFGVLGFWPAIVTGEISGITVIDCDSADAVAELERRGITSTMTQATKRGRHLVYRHAGERNTVRLGGIEGVDRRGEGGYVKAYAGCMEWTRAAVESLDVAPDFGEIVPVRRARADRREPARLAPDDGVAWDAARNAWRIGSGDRAIWLDPVTHEELAAVE